MALTIGSYEVSIVYYHRIRSIIGREQDYRQEADMARRSVLTRALRPTVSPEVML